MAAGAWCDPFLGFNAEARFDGSLGDCGARAADARTGSATVLVGNAANVAFSGPVTLALFASWDASLDAGLGVPRSGGTTAPPPTPPGGFPPDHLLAAVPSELTIRPGRGTTVRVKFIRGQLKVFHVIASIDRPGQVPESAEDNNLTASVKRMEVFVDFDFGPFQDRHAGD